MKEDFADFILCLGALHHMPTDCINEVRNLKRFSSQLLIYLYYNLDNRSIHYRYLLQLVTKLRLKTSQIHHAFLRKFFVKIGVFFIYLPLITLGRLLKLFRLENQIPLYEAYHNKSIKRIEQDVYDRFFTRIEQRVGKNDILKLKNDFTSVIVSENPPYYHFLCRK